MQKECALAKVSERLRGRAILVMGRAGLDLYPAPAGTKIEDATSFTAGLGGSAGNIAAALAIAGTETAMLSCVSDDAVGRYTLKELARRGIDTRYVRTVGGEARNTLALSESVLEGHETVVYRNGAADFEMGIDDVRAVDFSAYGGMVTAGTVLAAEPARSAALSGFDRARAAGCLCILDVDYRPYSWPSAEEASRILSQAAAKSDVIVGNDDEFGFMADAYEKGFAKARELAAEGRLVIYKMGERGAITLQGDAQIETPVFPVDTLKPVGAGDAFLGTMLAALVKGTALDDAVRRGAAAAAVVVTRPGCSIALPTPEELDAFIAQRS